MNPYTLPLRIGAVYASKMPCLRRRVTRVRQGIVSYVLYQEGARTVPLCHLPEDMFRDFTDREILPEELP